MRLFAFWALWRALRSKRRWRLFGDVRDFGARPDGVTDCTAAIQAALDHELTVRFPVGKFVLSEPLRMRAGQQIRGAHFLTTELKARRELQETA